MCGRRWCPVAEVELFASAGDGLAVEHFGLTGEGRVFVEAPAFSRALSYSSTQKALQVIDDEEKGQLERLIPGGRQMVSVIFEDGMWELIFRSTLPSAKAIKSRVKAILRRLREAGVVDTRPPLSELEVAERYVRALKRNAELESKADLADTFLISDGTQRLVREVAKLLGMKEGALRRFLVEERLIFPKHAPCGDVSYDFYADFAHHFVVKETVVNHTWGSCAHYTLRITARGIELIKKRLADRAAGPGAA